MKIIKVEQGSKEWHDLRRCRVTGTKLESVMGSNSDRTNLICELISEEATELTKAIRVTEEMERGTNEEIFAVKAFEAATKKKVDRVGLCISDEFDFLALSPDGLIKEKGKYTTALEVKCPDSKTAVFYRMTNAIPCTELGVMKSKLPWCGIPATYKWQAVNYFLVNTDLQTLNFVVYDARFIADDQKLYTVTIERTNEELQEALKEARAALVSFREDWLKYKEIILPSGF